MSRQIVITGVTGLLGSELAKRFIDRGDKVIGLKQKGTKKSKIDLQIELLEGDITDSIFLETAFQNADLVIHTAAMVSFDRRDKSRMFKTNVIGTQTVVNTCLQLKTPRLIFISSVAALGRDTKADLIHEETQWTNSDLNTNYASSKYLSELEFWRGIEEGLHGFCVNPSIILGCGELENSSNKIFQNLKKRYIPYTSGAINVVDLRDVADIIVQLEDQKTDAQKYIVNKQSIKIKDLMSYFSNHTGAKMFHAPKILILVAWFCEGLITFVQNKRSQVTSETLKVMKAESNYTNQKIIKHLNFTFRPLDETMKHCIAYYVEKYP